MSQLAMPCIQSNASHRQTYVADPAPKLFLHCHDLIHNLMRFQIPGKAALASCAEGAPHWTAHLSIIVQKMQNDFFL